MKTAIFYYSQSGQARRVAESMAKPLGDSGEVVFKEIVPVEKYPFPWPAATFFDTFPETRLGLPPSGIEPMALADVSDADVVIIVGQSWFLSLSLPLQSFFADQGVRQYLCGRKVVFVNACRNMWLMTIRKVKAALGGMGATLIGHVVLQDRAYNLVSVVTIVRWLIKGRQEATRLWPRAGVSERDISEASRFGRLVADSVGSGDTGSLQGRLLAAGAITYKPFIMFVEKAGHRMFGFWARFIRKKGGFRNPKRRFRVRLFGVYLHVALFVVAPVGKLFFYLTWPLHNVAAHKREDCGIN